MKTGVELIADERKRQIESEGWTKEHDAEHEEEQLAIAAMCYACPPISRLMIFNEQAQRVPTIWPWDPVWWKPSPDNRIKELVKAGALIAAEIDRLQNLNK